MKLAALCLAAAGLLGAQQFKIDLNHLAAKASDAVDISLNGATLQFAAKFLDGNDPDEAKVRKLIAGLQGIYIRSFEFKRNGEWSAADVERIKDQLKAPEWSRMVGYKSSEDGETADVYTRTEGGKITGVAIVAAEARELTVVNIVGKIDLDLLGELSGHFGVPKLEKAPKKEK